MPDTPAQRPATNFWDFLISIFELLADKGSATALVIVTVTLGMEGVMLYSLDAEARKEVVLSQSEMIAEYPSQRPLVTAVFIFALVSVGGNFYQRNVYRKHIEKLIPYRLVFFHHMETCFDFIKSRMKKNGDATWDDFKKLHPDDVVDIERHYGSGYKLGGHEK